MKVIYLDRPHQVFPCPNCNGKVVLHILAKALACTKCGYREKVCLIRPSEECRRVSFAEQREDIMREMPQTD